MVVPLVLLHPFPLDASFWDDVRPAFAARGPVLAPSFPGLGGVPPVDRPSVAAFADDVADLIGREAGGRAVVCGLSMGGYAALALAARHPARVAGLVLADTRAEADDPAGREGRDRAIAVVRERGLGAFLDEFLPRLVAPDAPAAVRERIRTIADRQPPAAVIGALGALRDRPDRVAGLAAVRAPTLVIVGEEDALTPPAFARTLAGGIPGARLAVLPGVGHMSAVEAPESFAREVLSFLATFGPS